MAIFVGGDVSGYRCASLLQMNAFTRHCISNFYIELPTLLFRHERFTCRERITFMQTPLFCKHLDADHLTEKIIHCRSQVTGTKLHELKSFQSCHQGLYCPALSHSRGREEVDVGFYLLKIQQLIYRLVIYNRWFWVAFLGANMFEVHRGQTVSFIHQRGGTIANSVR